MEQKLFIPQKLRVGFNHREDTYTKKLAYVIYYDQKNVLRKEKSFNGWIQLPGKTYSYRKNNERIESVIPDDYAPYDFENIPTEGFVLNKGVGGQRESWGWNARNEYIRVYDPRGFEFEISVKNLLYILENCTSTKGKGLEGKFVYSWYGTELVLLPVDTFEYKQSTEFTDLQSKKITKTDMIVGRVYQFKDTTVATYLGRLNYTEFNYYGPINKDIKLKHIFVTSQGKYIPESGFTKLAKIVNDNVDDCIADLIETYQNSKYNSPIKSISIEDVNNYQHLIDSIDENNEIDFIDGSYKRYYNLYFEHNNEIYKIYDKISLTKYNITNDNYIYTDNIFDHYNGTKSDATHFSNLLTQINIENEIIELDNYWYKDKYEVKITDATVDERFKDNLLIVELESGVKLPYEMYIKYY